MKNKLISRKKHLLILAAITLLLLTCLIRVFPSTEIVPLEISMRTFSRPEFPFEIVREELWGNGNCNTTILLPKDHFSKEKLTRLFLWYSSIQPAVTLLRVKVYTDKGRASSANFDRWPILPLYDPDDASFIRHYADNGASRDHFTEWYNYRPILFLPICNQRVILTENFRLNWTRGNQTSSPSATP